MSLVQHNSLKTLITTISTVWWILIFSVENVIVAFTVAPSTAGTCTPPLLLSSSSSLSSLSPSSPSLSRGTILQISSNTEESSFLKEYNSTEIVRMELERIFAGSSAEKRLEIQRIFNIHDDEDDEQQINKQKEEEEEESSKRPKYNWNQQWYPLHVIDTIDKSKPLKAYLLGKEVVIWYSENDGAWNVFEDACPHRQGPLSEGRIEHGNLLCSYHGWQFDSEGSCSSLPYSKDKLRSRHERSCRAQCQSFPTRVEHGLLFVFPQTGPDANLLAALTPITGIRELMGDNNNNDADSPSSSSSWRYKIPAGVRDFPCGWDTMVENTLDPAHFCAAHHGTLGNRYTDPQHYSQKVIKPLSSNIMSNDPFVVQGDFGTLEFQPPCLVRYTPDNPSMPFGGKMTIATYCVPTRPGWVRPLATVLVQERPPFWWLQENVQLSEYVLEVFMNPLTPAWLGHILSSIVLHQDAGLLYYQHRNFRRKGYLSQDEGNDSKERKKTYHELAFMPNEADKAVTIFRQWLQKTSDGGDVTFDKSYTEDQTEAIDIFDMWQAHTSQCKNCSDAYNRLETIRKLAWVVFYGSILVSPVVATSVNTEVTEGMMITPWSSFAVGIASASLALALDNFNSLFRRYEVRHTDDAIIDKLPFGFKDNAI